MVTATETTIKTTMTMNNDYKTTTLMMTLTRMTTTMTRTMMATMMTTTKISMATMNNLAIPTTATSSQRAPRELPELPSMTMTMISGENADWITMRRTNKSFDRRLNW